MRIAMLAILVAVVCVSATPDRRGARPSVHRQPLLLAATDSGGEAAAVIDEKKVRTEPPPPPLKTILRKAAKRAIGGGLSGWIAGVVQVICLMWLRTAMNYQYRYGTSTAQALRTLYAQGGIARFYRGMGWALLQTPLSRFGDAAANSGMRELLSTTALPMGVQTACAGLAAALWRVSLTPLDTLKTTLQVEGAAAYALLVQKVGAGGVGVLYAGASASMLASFVGNYPWWFTFNYLDKYLPRPDVNGPLAPKLCRNAALGVSATCVSDTISNSLRVLKTTRQTTSDPLTYLQAAQLVISSDGWKGLFLRGLGTRLITNCIQASLFTIVWKIIEEKVSKKELEAQIAASVEATPEQGEEESMEGDAEGSNTDPAATEREEQQEVEVE